MCVLGLYQTTSGTDLLGPACEDVKAVESEDCDGEPCDGVLLVSRVIKAGTNGVIRTIMQVPAGTRQGARGSRRGSAAWPSLQAARSLDGGQLLAWLSGPRDTPLLSIWTRRCAE